MEVESGDNSRAQAISITSEDGSMTSCICATPDMLLVEAEFRHVVWIMADLKKRMFASDACLSQLIAYYVFPFLEVSVGTQNLWEAFGIKKNGHPRWGKTVKCLDAINLLARIPTNRLLGLDWQFPGIEGDGTYSLLHRACDPALEGLFEAVPLALLQRSDFHSCNAKRFGITALHFMASRGWSDACRRLIQRPDFTETLEWVHASVESTNGVVFFPGDLVTDVARRYNHTDVVTVVRETLAEKNKALLEQLTEHIVQEKRFSWLREGSRVPAGF